MEKEIIKDSEFAEISYSDELKLARIVWKKSNIPSEIFRETYLILLNYTENVNGKYFLSDGRLQGAISPDDRIWFMDYAIGRAIKNGLIRTAVVGKNSPFRKYYLNFILKFVMRKTKLEMKLFDDYEDAINWLKK